MIALRSLPCAVPALVALLTAGCVAPPAPAEGESAEVESALWVPPIKINPALLDDRPTWARGCDRGTTRVRASRFLVKRKAPQPSYQFYPTFSVKMVPVTCASVPGAGGEWRGAPLDARRSNFCVYRWVATRAGAWEDFAALLTDAARGLGSVRWSASVPPSTPDVARELNDDAIRKDVVGVCDGSSSGPVAESRIGRDQTALHPGSARFCLPPRAPLWVPICIDPGNPTPTVPPCGACGMLAHGSNDVVFVMQPTDPSTPYFARIEGIDPADTKFVEINTGGASVFSVTLDPALRAKMKSGTVDIADSKGFGW